MDVVLDTSSIINLINGEVIDRILNLTDKNFYIGDQVLSKELLNDVQKIVVQALIAKRKLYLLEQAVTISDIVSLQRRYKLGLGETECMAICRLTNKAICTDDLKARKSSITELGESKLLGTMVLLKNAVSAKALECAEALRAYQLMIKRGGFLPRNLSAEYFCH